MADREGDSWAVPRKGNLGGSEEFIGGRRRRHFPNISDSARKLGKRRPCCKRNAHCLFCDLFSIGNSTLLLLVVGQLSEHPSPPMESVSGLLG